MGTRKLIAAECFNCRQDYLFYWNLDKMVLKVPRLYCNKCLAELDWHFFDAPLAEDGYVDKVALSEMFSEDYVWGVL